MRFISINTGILLTAFVFAGGAASAQTADEIIAKSLTALGGRATLSKVTTQSLTGTMSISTPNGDIAGTIESVQQAPNKIRRLITLDLSQFGAGSATIETRFDGTTGVTLDSMRGDVPMTASQLATMKNSIFPSPFLNYKDRDTKITLAGKEKVGEHDGYALLVTPASGPVSRVIIDGESYLPVKAVITVELPDVGSLEQTTEFSDFREVNGMKVPHKIKGTSSVQTFVITVTKVEQNGKVDPELFSTKPGK